MKNPNPYDTPQAKELSQPTRILSAGGLVLLAAAVLFIVLLFFSKATMYRGRPASPPSPPTTEALDAVAP